VPKAKISIVDDDEFVLEGIEHLVRSLGYDVDIFASANNFLTSNGARDAACLITDVMMPDMTGIELQRRLVADGYQLPVIFMSGLTDEKIRADLLKTGAIGFLAKPVQVDRLIELLNKALKG
jgi:FixJ family two-component response regulator